MDFDVSLNQDDLMRMYDQMVLIREFEERSAAMYAQAKIGGFLHLYSGEEAVGVGAMQSLHCEDYVVSGYRDHGYALLRGCPPREVMAELFGKRSGLCKGKGGSMHLFDYNRRFMGGYAIVAAGLPIAAGLALAINYGGGDEVVACFFGDGAVNQGNFHEALNLSSLWRLPVVWICENNFYGIGTAVGRASAVPEIWKRACGYNMPSVRVDGMDAIAVYKAVDEATQRARDGGGPSFIEALTYRFRTHSPADPGGYRSKREEQIWRSRDPIKRMGAYLLERGYAEPQDLDRMKSQAVAKVDEAVKFAEESDPPGQDELWEDVFKDDHYPGLKERMEQPWQG